MFHRLFALFVCTFVPFSVGRSKKAKKLTSHPNRENVRALLLLSKLNFPDNERSAQRDSGNNKNNDDDDGRGGGGGGGDNNNIHTLIE